MTVRKLRQTPSNYYIPGCDSEGIPHYLSRRALGSRLLEPTAGVPKFALRRLGGEALRSVPGALQERTGSVAAAWRQRGEPGL